MRLFYAIEFPDPVKQRLAEVSSGLAALSARGRWSRPDNIHMTIQFVGECPGEWLADLRNILRRAALSTAPFDLTIQGWGTFGDSQDILWLGIEREPELEKLAGTLKVLLRQQNLPFDRRPYTAHITLARQVHISREQLTGWQYPPISCPVRSVSLMESRREEGVLVYRALERAQLGLDMR